MSVSPVDLIAAQLREAAPDAEWNAAGEDRARELAALFHRAGVYDLSSLSIEQIPAWEALNLVRYANDPRNDDELAALRCNVQGRERMFGCRWFKSANGNEKFTPSEMLFQRGYAPLRFRFAENKVAGFLGDTNLDSTISNEAPLFKFIPDLQITIIGWSARGNGHVNYVVTPGPNGFTIRPLWGNSSDKKWIIENVKAIVSLWSIAFAFAGAGSLGSALGEQIVGAQFAASYPGVTSAIGNTALSAAMNGGDVEAAVKGAVVSYGAGAIGVQVGTQVAQVTDIEAIGRIAQAATTAYIRGGDVPGAMRFALLQSIPDAFPVAPELSIEEPSMNFSISNWPDANDWQVAADPWGVSSLPGVVPPAWEAAPMPSMLDYVQPAVEPIGGGGGGGFWQTSRDWAGSVFNRENVRAARDVVTDIAAIVGTVRAIENPPQPGQPAPRAAVQNPNQVIRNPNGSVTVAAPDGSVRVISAEEVRRASGAAGGVQITPTMMAVGGAALVAVFLLARKR